MNLNNLALDETIPGLFTTDEGFVVGISDEHSQIVGHSHESTWLLRNNGIKIVDDAEGQDVLRFNSILDFNEQVQVPVDLFELFNGFFVCKFSEMFFVENVWESAH